MGVPPLLTGPNIRWALAAVGVGAGCEHAIPPGRPGGEFRGEGCGLLSGRDLAQGTGQSQQFLAGGGARIAGQMLADGGMEVEITPLGGRVGPQGSDHRFQGSMTVDHRDIWWHELLEQSRPGGGLFAVTALPAHHVCAVVGDQGAVVVEIRAIQHQISVNFPGRLGLRWGDVPAPGSAPVKGALTNLGGFDSREQPGDKPAEFMAPGHIISSGGLGLGRPTTRILASIALRTGFGFAIGPHRATTYTTVRFFPARVTHIGSRLCQCSSCRTTMPNHRVKKNSFCQLTHQLNVDLLNENIQVDLGGGVQLPLIGEDGSGLLELGQLGALHSYAYTPSEDQGMRSIAAAGAITEDGSIAVDPTGDEGNPARVNLTALFDQLDVEGLTDEVVDAAALEVGALASRAEHNDGELVRNYQLAGAELVFSSPLVGAFTDDLEGVTSGLGEALEESLGSTGALGDVTEALEVINLDLGVLTAGVEESSIAIDGLDEALAELSDRTLQGTVSSDTGLVEVNLETGEITVDLEQVMTGGLNDQDPNTSLLDATTIERITDELATVLGNVVTDLRDDDLIATLDEIDLTINLDLTLEAALIDLADGGATVNGSLASFLGLVDESPAITSDLDLLGLLPLGELLTPLLNQVVGVLGNVVGGTVNPIIDARSEGR